MAKRKNKKGLILDAMRKLIVGGRAMECSVSEIANAAGIGKGSIYYYYRSRREIEIDLAHRTYDDFVEKCKAVLNTKMNSLEKLKTLFTIYCSESVDSAMSDYLHLPQNMDMHQKVLAQLVNEISPIVSKVFEQGISEGVFECGKPDEYAQIFVCVFAFMFDVGIFKHTKEDTINRLAALAEIVEKSLKVKKGALSFIHDKEFLHSLPLAENFCSPFNLTNS